MTNVRSVELDRLVALAEAEEKQGQLREAEVYCRQALALDSTYVPAILRFGVVAAKLGDMQAALRYLSVALRVDPTCFEAIKWLSVAFRGGIDVQRALLLSKQAVQMRPDDAEAQNNLGLCFLALHRLGDAETYLRKAVALQPDLVIAHHNLGICLRHRGRYEEAAECFKTATQLAPKAPQSFVSLGQLLISEGRTDEAKGCFQGAFEAAAGSYQGYLELALAFMQDDTLDEAARCLRAAIEVNSKGAQPHALLGKVLQQEGRFEDAASELRTAIELQPDRIEAYFDLTYCRRVTSHDGALIDHMLRILDRPGLAAIDLRHLHYSLGKAYDDLGDYERAMHHFDEANSVIRRHLGHVPLDRAKHAKIMAEVAATFDPLYFQRLAKEGNPSELPVLVVGMIRSGTTLVEQILSSHPQIGAAGELRFLSEKGWGLIGAARDVWPGMASQLGKDYLKVLRAADPAAKRVIDKMPHNFAFSGMFHMMFPNGRIIHCRRNPVDTCLSIYTTPFREVLSFAHDRETIVFFYREYAKLMDHWRQVLPADRFFEVDYEDLVANREAVTRRMIEFCGEPWDDACLHHEDNARHVTTPSQWQARQPIYATSVERWRNYEPWLGAFRELLA